MYPQVISYEFVCNKDQQQSNRVPHGSFAFTYLRVRREDEAESLRDSEDPNYIETILSSRSEEKEMALARQHFAGEDGVQVPLTQTSCLKFATFLWDPAIAI